MKKTGKRETQEQQVQKPRDRRKSDTSEKKKGGQRVGAERVRRKEVQATAGEGGGAAYSRTSQGRSVLGSDSDSVLILWFA